MAMDTVSRHMLTGSEGAYLKLRSSIAEIVQKRPVEDGYIAKLHQAVLETDEIMAALQPLLENRVTMGRRVQMFEQKFSHDFGLKHPVMSNSGSSANLLAVSALCSPALGILAKGDEVILPALLWSTTIWPVIQNGLVPVIVDIDPETLNINVEQIEAAITEKTKAIMLVHIMGNPCEMDKIMDISRKRSLVVIEDCCEALGAFYKGKPVGSFGVVSSFSFYYSHHITTIEGGMNCSSDVEIADRMKIMRAHGWSRDSIHTEQYVRNNPDIDSRWLFVDTGYNLRPTEVNAAIGLVQLGRTGHVIGKRQENGDQLRRDLNRFGKYLHFQKTTEDSTHPWFYFSVIVSKSAPFSRQELTAHLEASKIETRPLLTGNVVRQPAMKFLQYRVGQGNGDLPVADWITSHGFAVGIHSEMATAITTHIVNAFTAFFQKYE